MKTMEGIRSRIIWSRTDMISSYLMTLFDELYGLFAGIYFGAVDLLHAVRRPRDEDEDTKL